MMSKYITRTNSLSVPGINGPTCAFSVAEDFRFYNDVHCDLGAAAAAYAVDRYVSRHEESFRQMVRRSYDLRFCNKRRSDRDTVRISGAALELPGKHAELRFEITRVGVQLRSLRLYNHGDQKCRKPRISSGDFRSQDWFKS
jgi:hypothetical protein